ncbi:hypothetical protein [Phyllobacterium sp. SB3]|uniref:hypothetical protein n=1 Tax=Phyllobacterium sp. SB3 TaxID=3156073 RepID=UPI0032AFE4DE
MTRLSNFASGAATAERNRQRMRRNGFTMNGHKLWSDDEREFITKLFPDIDAICKQLPHRTRVAVLDQCRKMNFRRHIHFWTAAEISKLRRMYPAASKEDICSIFSHSTWINIRQVARYHGMRRDRKPYKKTGIVPLDQVRDKCFDIRWTMVDLDQASRTKSYFQKSNWIGKRLNYKALGKAVRALDGRLRVEWPD